MNTVQSNVITNRKVFASRNSYTGFVNHFDTMFNSEEFERIYVLKGGPGSGKSSIMKKIANEYAVIGYTTTAIFCSSDT